jgi:hypothetical protein
MFDLLRHEPSYRILLVHHALPGTPRCSDCGPRGFGRRPSGHPRGRRAVVEANAVGEPFGPIITASCR